MGRSGGGHSSSGRSGGGFSGGHSSGGFSGGGRSSGSYSSGSHSSRNYSSRGHSSSWNHSFSSRPGRSPIFPWGHRPIPPRVHRRPHTYVGGYGYGGGLFTFIVTFIIIIIFLSMIMSVSSNTNNNQIEKSTKERVALSGVVNKTDWYDDQIGWISSKNILISGLEDFYKETGIQPYILFVPYSSDYWNGSTINSTAADNYLEAVYNEKFTDEAHFIFAYFSCKNDTKSEMDGEFRYLSGYSADTIMDNEAINILWGYFEKNYYNTSLSIEKMISNTFSETAKSIMSAPTNFWDFANATAIVIVIIVIVVVIYLTVKSKHKREKEKEKYTEEILSKPLETFGNDTSDLEDKYK